MAGILKSHRMKQQELKNETDPFQQKVDVLVRWARGEKPGPCIVDISPTDYCNLKCRSCWMRNEMFEGKLDSREYELSEKRLLCLVEEGAALGVKAWEITGGGEPFMRRDLTFRLIRRIRELGMEGSLTTNGTLFTAKIVRKMVDIGWSKVVFSVDGYDDESNDTLRGRKKSFAKAMKALALFQEAKRAKGADLPLIAFNTVLSSGNFDHMKEMIELADNLGVGMVNFEPVTVHSPLGETLVLDDAQRGALTKHAKAANRRARELGVETNAGAYTGTELVENANTMRRVITGEVGRRGGKHPLLDVLCYEPWYHLVIKVDGQAGPCCIADIRKMRVKDESLEEIWFGKHFSSIRKSILDRKLPRYCSICNAGQVLYNRAIRAELGRILDAEPPELSVEGAS